VIRPPEHLPWPQRGMAALIPGVSDWLMFALDMIVEGVVRNTTLAAIPETPGHSYPVHAQVLVDSFPGVLLCPVFFMADICIDHALLKTMLL